MIFIKSILKAILYKPLYNALMFLVWLTPGNSLGVAIIILTILVRLVLLPSSAKAVEAQKQLKELQPKLDKIKEEHKDDKQAQSQAMMSFYRENKINPLSSCLPLLIQLPILIILYYVFRDGLDTSKFDLLYSFTPHPSLVNPLFLGINLSIPNIYLAVLTGILQFIQTKQMMPKIDRSQNSPKKDDQMSQLQNLMGSQMTYVMPAFTVFIAMSLPSALAVYWITTTLFAIGQQWWILNRKTTTDKVKVEIRKR